MESLGHSSFCRFNPMETKNERKDYFSRGNEIPPSKRWQIAISRMKKAPIEPEAIVGAITTDLSIGVEPDVKRIYDQCLGVLHPAAAPSSSCVSCHSRK